MYSEIFCRVYNAFGWNYYPEVFGEQLLLWLEENRVRAGSALDLACGTGVLCDILHRQGICVWGMDLSPGMITVAREQTPGVHFDVADMLTYRPGRQFDLVTCTGDALNHIPQLQDLGAIFSNVYDWLEPGGYFLFDLLDEGEISDSEPFDVDFTDTVRVWFQMTRPEKDKVALTVKVFEEGRQVLEEVIRETVHDVREVCALLRRAGFRVERCAHSLRPGTPNGTTWFLIARKDP